MAEMTSRDITSMNSDSSTPIKVETTSEETKTDVPQLDSDPKILELPLEQNDTRIIDSEGAQSPASSTYGDCEETVSPSSEHSPEVSKAVVETDPVDVASKTSNDKVDDDDDDSYKEVVDLEPSASDNSKTEKQLTENTSCNEKSNVDEKTDVDEKVDEIYVTDEIVNGDYEDELEAHEDYDDEDGQKSPRQIDW